MDQQSAANRGSFRGSFGFVMAAAGSAVGLGNIWRFPYLAAKNGGGLFLLVYLVLTVTFGFTMVTTEIAIGRKTRHSAIMAFPSLRKGTGWIGVLQTVIPLLVMPYYAVIGGWVTKYQVSYLAGSSDIAESSFFPRFTGSTWEPLLFLAVFLIFCAVIVFLGVEKGIEGFSKTLMPVLVLMVLGIAVYSVTLRHTGDPERVVTGLEGLRYFIVPSFEGLTVSGLFRIIVDAATQLFFSLSIAMGILISYGSYVPDKTNLVRSVAVIEIFDSLIAFLAGAMVIPAVYVFMGPENLSMGPSLLFASLPKIFAQMGSVGRWIGLLFFSMVFFAALTSGIAIMEAVVSGLMERFRWSRKKAVAVETLIALGIGTLVCFGYNLLYFDISLPNGSRAQFLDVLDFFTNNLLMPVSALIVCIFIGWIVKPKTVTDEVSKNGAKFVRKTLYNVMIRFIAPVLVVIILLTSFGIL